MITEDIVQENEDTKLVTATEVKNEINNTEPKKAPGFDPITGVTGTSGSSPNMYRHFRLKS